jgi:hypothetical protein
MTPRTSSPRQDPAASRAIDAIIKASGDWRSTTLARLRAVVLSADAAFARHPSRCRRARRESPRRAVSRLAWNHRSHRYQVVVIAGAQCFVRRPAFARPGAGTAARWCGYLGGMRR